MRTRDSKKLLSSERQPGLQQQMIHGRSSLAGICYWHFYSHSIAYNLFLLALSKVIVLRCYENLTTTEVMSLSDHTL